MADHVYYGLLISKQEYFLKRGLQRKMYKYINALTGHLWQKLMHFHFFPEISRVNFLRYKTLQN